MKKILIASAILLFVTSIYSQQRITKKELELLKKHNDEAGLLKDEEDFKNIISTGKWDNESAVILCQKTKFDFDKKGISIGTRIGRNIFGLVFALPTLGTSIYGANARNETSIIVEETERRRILLNDKFAIDAYSILYFRLAAQGDAFAARVIKKDGTIKAVDFNDAVKVEDVKSVPGLFKSYTDNVFKSNYRPDFFKIAVSDLEEGDIIEYEYKNYNTRQYVNNPNYKEFEPVYYLCNRVLPVNKQIIEVATEDEKYYMSFKSLKGAPDFTVVNNGDKKTYRWVDINRERLVDTRFVNEFLELPSVKFQVIYARNRSRDFVWFKDENDNKKDFTPEELAEKAKIFWFKTENVQGSSFATGVSYSTVIKQYFKDLKKKAVTEASDDDYARKAYYYLRSKTLYNNSPDFDFAKVFSGLLDEKKINHEIVVTTPNSRTTIEKAAFVQEVSWLIKIKNKYFVNPDEHLNPEETSIQVAGNVAASFKYNDAKATVTKLTIPLADTTDNSINYSIKASLDATAKANLSIEKSVEAKGFVRDEIIDDVLALMPYMETDYKNYDGTGMWEGMSETAAEKATSEFNTRKKEWKEEKPKLQKAMLESDYNMIVDKYDAFKLTQDGRNFKKKSLKFTENFVLQDFTSTANDDIILPLPRLLGIQTRIKKDERNRILPVDTRYARTLSWNITLPIPQGYTAKGIEALNKKIDNECASFTCVAKVENGNIVLDVKKIYKGKNFDVQKWPQLTAVLDAAYSFSQAKIVLKKS